MTRYYAGLDVSMEKTYIWVLDAEGEDVFHGEVETCPEALRTRLDEGLQGGAARGEVKVCLESGSLSHWLGKALQVQGFDVV